MAATPNPTIDPRVIFNQRPPTPYPTFINAPIPRQNQPSIYSHYTISDESMPSLIRSPSVQWIHTPPRPNSVVSVQMSERGEAFVCRHGLGSNCLGHQLVRRANIESTRPHLGFALAVNDHIAIIDDRLNQIENAVEIFCQMMEAL